MEEYLNDVSRIMKHKALDEQMIEDCTDSMAQAIQGSTRIYFEENKLYQELPQNLQLKVVKIILKNYMKTFEYFFEDFRTKNKAPMTFIVRVLTNLD